MGKGRYLKAAERACARKARFETRAAAEAFVAGRYRAYRCVVCGAYHLTSGRGDRPEPPEPAKREPPGPKLGDLDWSAVLEPKAPPDLSPPSPFQDEPPGKDEPRTARVAAPCGKDGRARLVVEGRLVKSRPVDRTLRTLLVEGTTVRIEGDPPTVLGTHGLSDTPASPSPRRGRGGRTRSSP